MVLARFAQGGNVKNTTFAVGQTGSIIRSRVPLGNPGAPLVYVSVTVEANQRRPDSVTKSNEEIGGLFLCA
jgi:hypothetical protein